MAQMADRPQLPLDWLFPTLDQCRLAIRKGVERSWQKGGSSSSLATVTDLDLKIEDTLVGQFGLDFPMRPL